MPTNPSLRSNKSAGIFETETLSIVNPSNRYETNKMTYNQRNEIDITSAIHSDKYISLSSIDKTPIYNSNTIFWVNSIGDIIIRKKNKTETINLFETLQPQGFSIDGKEPHNKPSNLNPIGGQGSIQFKKSEFALGASSQFQYDYGDETLLISNIAPYDKSAELNFSIYDDNESKNNVLTFRKNSSKEESDFNSFVCEIRDSTLKLNNASIRGCTKIGFDGASNDKYIEPILDSGFIYTTKSRTDSVFPFDSDGNLIIQPNYDKSIVFATTQGENDWKNTLIIKDDEVSINPSRNNQHKTFIEFSAHESQQRRMNIHGQTGDQGIWSLVHTLENNLEFQYFESDTQLNDENPSQILTLKKVTQDNAFSINNKHLCVFGTDDEVGGLFRNELSNNSIIYITHSANSYILSNDSSDMPYENNGYTVFQQHLTFNVIDTSYQSILFYVPHSPMFSSTNNMDYDNAKSAWIPNSNSFSFVNNLTFIDLYYENSSNSYSNIIMYDPNQTEYSAYLNGYSGFLATTIEEGGFRNQANQGSLNLVNLEDCNPIITKCSMNSDPKVIGVIGRMEKDGNFVNRPFYWGAFGTTLKDRTEPRIFVSYTGFVGAWVVADDGTDNIEYATGDLLTSHSCGALQKQHDDIVHSYTVAKFIVDSYADPDRPSQTENTDSYRITQDGVVITLELKGVLLMM